MDDSEILARIQQMVKAEHELRARLHDGGGSDRHAAGQLKALEESLDQAWDLLRQRRARREFAQDPDTSHPRPTNEVESYLQ
jgi:hypothetical protein